MASPTTVGLAGDVMLGRGVDRAQADRSPGSVWGGLLDRLQTLDGFVCNLECCLSTRGEPWTATYHPFHFRADPTWAVPALQAVDCTAVGLANNHALDYGPLALEDTLAVLDQAGIAVAGAGPDREAAFEPVTFQIADLDVGLLAVTDNSPEFAATQSDTGVAYVDLESDPEPTVVQETVASALDRNPALLLASVHLGPNMVTTPADRFRHFTRWLVDLGVDVVFGHSAHVFQGIEQYARGLIIHDAGDFVDDYAVDPDLRNDRGFLFELEVVDGEPSTLRLVPTEIESYAVHPAPEPVADWSRRRMRSRSEAFGTSFEQDGEELVLSL